MRIIFLNGGLANQTFQYIFYRYCELTYPEKGPWILDNSFFYVQQAHNGYELEKVFGLHPNLLSQNFDEDVWEEFIRNKKNGISIPGSLKNLGFDVTFIAEYSGSAALNPFEGPIYRLPDDPFSSNIAADNSPITYYHAYALDKRYFDTYYDILKKELSFPPLSDQANLNYAHHILCRHSIAVHIRRGDFVTLNVAMENEYFHFAITQMLQRTPDAHFYIFSDDLEWCREHRDELGLSLTSNITYVSGNKGSSSFRDLQLMSLCQGIVICNSSFSYLAYVLSDTLQYAINPTTRPL